MPTHESHIRHNNRIAFLRLRDRAGLLTVAERDELRSSMMLVGGDAPDSKPIAVPLPMSRADFLARYGAPEGEIIQHKATSDTAAAADETAQTGPAVAPRRFDVVGLEDPCEPSRHPSVPGHAPKPLRDIRR
jgi:hypothetical protein